jgi:hypothetical protein
MPIATPEERIKMVVGDLTVTIQILQHRIEELQLQLRQATQPPMENLNTAQHNGGGDATAARSAAG